MVKCPHCQQKWVSTLGCVNPDCDFKVKYSIEWRCKYEVFRL